MPDDGVGVYPRLLAATIVVLLPGGLIADALGRRSASATLLWSLAAVAAALGVVFLLESSLDVAFAVLAAISLVALGVAVVRRRPRPPRVRGSAIVVGVGFLLGLALWHVAGHVAGDGLFHLARVRKLVELDGLSPAALNEFADGDLHPGYAFPVWHAFLALVSELAGVDSEQVVLHLPSVLAPLALLVVHEAGTVLFRSAWLGGALAAANTALIAFAPGHGGAFTTLSLPGTASRQLIVPAVLTLAFTQARDPAPAVVAGLAAGGLVLTLVHPTYALFLAVPLAGFVAVRALWSRRDALRLLVGGAAYAAATGVVLAFLVPLARGAESFRPDDAELARALRRYAAQLDVFSSGSYRLSPDVFTRSGAVAVAALALVPLAAFASRRRWSAWVLGGSLPVLALLLVPELFMQLSEAVSLSQSRRAAGFLPFAFALVGGAGVLAQRVGPAVVPLGLAAGVALQLAYPGDFTARLTSGDGGQGGLAWFAALAGACALAAAVATRSRGHARGREWLAGLAVLAFCLPVAVHGAAEWSTGEARRPSPLTPGLVTALRDVVPERAVVFSDLESSYRMAAAAPVYIAAGPPAHVADTERNRPYERREHVILFLETGDLAIPLALGAEWLVIDRTRTRAPIPLVTEYRDARYELYRLG